MTTHLRSQWREAGSSWRAMGDDDPWNRYDAAVLSDGGPSGRKSYEVYDHGQLVAVRPSLREAKDVIGERWDAAPQWSTYTPPSYPTTHYHFGPTEEFTSPTTVWVATQ